MYAGVSRPLMVSCMAVWWAKKESLETPAEGINTHIHSTYVDLVQQYLLSL